MVYVENFVPVDAGHRETLEDDSVELGLGTTSEELVELDSKAEVGILADGVLTNVLLLVLETEIDTLKREKRQGSAHKGLWAWWVQ